MPAVEMAPARTIAHYIEPTVARAMRDWALGWQRMAVFEPAETATSGQ